MKLTGFALYRYTLPLTEPLKLAGATLHSREGALVQLSTTGGVESWGEASPLPGFSNETLEQAVEDLSTGVSSVVGVEILEAWQQTESDLVPSARFGLETAFLNLRATAAGRTLPEMISPRPRTKVAGTTLLSGAPEEVLRLADEARRAGYRTAKLKVGEREVEDDANLAKEVARRLGGDAVVRIDANRAWSLEDALEFVRLTHGLRLECPVEYLEEPLKDPASLPDLVEKTGAPVALDESLTGMTPEDLKDHGHASAVVLKPTLLGLSRTLRFAEEATRLGMTPVVSSAYEAGVGMTALVALAAAIGDAPAGLDTYRWLAEDVVNPRLDLTAPELDVREFFAIRREVDVAGLELVREYTQT